MRIPGLKSIRFLRDPLEIGSNPPPMILAKASCKIHIGNYPRPTVKFPTENLAKPRPVMKYVSHQTVATSTVSSLLIKGSIKPSAFFGCSVIVWGIFFTFCDFRDQEEQKALPLGLASALPARGQFMPQMTYVWNFFSPKCGKNENDKNMETS